MSSLTNSLRPTEQVNKPAGADYSAYKLRGICARCSVKSYQTTYNSHPIFKIVCPDCKAYLVKLKQQSIMRNAEANSKLVI